MTVLKKATLILPLLFWLESCGDADDTPRLARDTRATDGKAQAIFNSGLAAEKAGKSKRAIKNYRKIANEYPLFPSAHEAAYRRGKLLMAAGEPLEAFESFENVLTKYPASPHYTESMKNQQKIALDAANGNITESFIWIKTRVSVKDCVEMLKQVRQNAPRTPAAELAQFTIGRLYQKEGGDLNYPRAISAYRELTREYPDSKYAPGAQLQIGKILLNSAKKGNQDSANLDRARQVFDDLILAYPSSKEAGIARAEIKKLSTGEIKRTFDIAEFYRKKGNTPSALFYYQETVNRSKSGPLHDKAAAWVKKLSKP